MPDYKESVPDAVRRIVDRGYDDICEKLDNIKDAEPAAILDALKERGEIDLADYYEEWLGDDAPRAPETDPGVGSGVVPDPADSPSYDALKEHLRNVELTRKTGLRPGALVRYWPGVREGVGRVGRTRSEVWEVSGQPVVSIHGYAGGVALTHVELIEPAPGPPDTFNPTIPVVPSAPPYPEHSPAPVVDSPSFSGGDCGGGGGE
jgi:hypothetical protein